MMMKRLTTLLFTMCITLLGFGRGVVTPAQSLIKRLIKIQKRGVMIGHQDDPVYGRTWKWERNRSDVRDLVGVYPAVMGFDLGWIERLSDVNLDKVPFSRIREEIILQYERGGIVTLSWHPTNPITGQSAWGTTPGALRQILPGGAEHSKFCGWLQQVAAFLNSLKSPKTGKPIPVIFRPWHEMNGDWFWWGAKNNSPEEFKQLYIMTHDLLTKQYGCHHLVWAYSPNAVSGDTEERYMAYYPGDSYVDLLGIDLYDFDHNNARYQQQLREELHLITQIGDEREKLTALTETGAQTLPDKEWFTKVFWPVAENFPIAYVLFWRNAWDAPKELYMSSKGHPTEQDFKLFYEQKCTLFVNNIK